MIHKLENLLKSNPYPGRGIAVGCSSDGEDPVIIYFIMGRSENSRNRIFEKMPDGIRTAAFDAAKMTDPSLIIYHPVRTFEGNTIVTNGDQTDTIREILSKGGSFREALETREFEPDAPNYTPRISAIVAPGGSYEISILKTMESDPEHCLRFFYQYPEPMAGTGHFISTYETDGDPLPSFQGEPVPVSLSGADNIESFAQHIWDALNEDNKVSLYACRRNKKTGQASEVIINKNTTGDCGSSRHVSRDVAQ